MRRILITAAALLAVASVTAAEAAAARPTARLRGFTCQQAIRPVARGVSVTAVMRPVKATKRMSLRFELLSRTSPGGSWSPVTAGDLGSWISPTNPTLGQRAADVWIFNKSVNDLAAPAAYRFRVTFRWTGAHSRTLATAVRSTAVCGQPELRPDVLVQSIDVQPIKGKPKLNRYVATILNGGASPARRFRVQFAPGGGNAPAYRSIRLLAAHTSSQVAFVEPACSTTAASTITADPDGVVDDFNRANNTATADCSSITGQQ